MAEQPTAPVLMTGFDVTPAAVSGNVGETVKLTISNIQPNNTTNGNIMPSVQDASVATITPEANSLILDVKLIKAGTTEIDLKSVDGNVTKTVPVAVSAKQDKPAWQVKAEKLARYIDGVLWVQLAYRSDNNHKCDPILLSEKQVGNVFPIVVDAPTGLNDPVFDYSRNIWIENSATGQARQIATLTQEVSKIKSDQEAAAEAKTQDDKESSKVLKLVTMMSSQLGAISSKVDNLTQPAEKKEEAKAQPTNSEVKEGE